MSSVESSIQSFVIRVWVEERAESSDSLPWRGHITHVPTGAKQYLKDLDDILAFMVPYMNEMGVNVKRPQR